MGGPARLRAACALVALAIAGAIVPASAQEAGDAAPAAAARLKQPWAVACSGDQITGRLVCAISQTLVSQQTGQKLVSVQVRKDDKGATSAIFNLPHGIELPKGVAVKVDQGAEETIVIRSADENGSYATLPLPEPRLAELRRGSILSLAVQTLSGDRIIFEISLAGFSAAYGMM
jgi:invasion protein IalB